MPTKSRGLGKGLEALFADNATTDRGNAVSLSISEIEPNRSQPRKNFDEKALAELADSIRQHGIITPILVRPLANGGYQLVAGERRWRAARMAGLNEIPVLVKDLSDSETMEIALIENLQREDLNPIEEAEGYRSLIDTYGLTQDEVATRVNKSRPAVANSVRLLNLPKKISEFVRDGKLSSGHARALLSLESEAQMQEFAELVIKKELTVRDVEKLAKSEKKEKSPQKPQSNLRDSYFGEMELALKTELGRKVKITENGKGQGVIELAFFDKEDLADIAAQLAGKDR